MIRAARVSSLGPTRRLRDRRPRVHRVRAVVVTVARGHAGREHHVAHGLPEREIGAQNMCGETSGPRGSSSHSGCFQIRSNFQYVIGSVVFCRYTIRGDFHSVAGCARSGGATAKRTLLAVLVDGPPERAALVAVVGHRVVDVVLEHRADEQRAVDALDHLVDVVERPLGAERAEALAEHEQLRTRRLRASSPVGPAPRGSSPGPSRRPCRCRRGTRSSSAGTSTGARRGRVAVVHVLERRGRAFVDPARPGRREHRDDLARPRVGAVELLEREVDPLLQRVGRLEAHVDPDRLLRRLAVEFLDLLSVGPIFSPIPVKSRPCTPSVFHGTSDAGLPLRSGWVGCVTPGSVPSLIDRVRGVQRVERGVEQEALDQADDDHDRHHDTDRHRTARGANRSMNRMTTRANPRTRREIEQQDRRDHDGQDQDHDPVPQRSSRSCPSGRARRSATIRRAARKSGTSTTVAPSKTHHAIRLKPRLGSSIAACGSRPRARCRSRSRSRRRCRDSTPCRTSPRGSSDGVSERQKNTSAPARPPKHSRRRNSHRSLARTRPPRQSRRGPGRG